MYIKVNDSWKEVTGIYKKANGVFTPITESDLSTYISNNVLKFMGYYVTLVLSIMAPDSVSAETVTCEGYNGSSRIISGMNWEIISGNSYASINQTSGVITISSSASSFPIRVRLTYQGSTVEKDITVTYSAGSSATYTETETETGVEKTTTITNQDGSSSSVTTIYDQSGNETGHVNENTDTSGNKKTQTIQKDENGNDEVIGYVIDTSGNESGGLTEPGIDTGVLALDGSGFDIHMVYNITMSEQGNPYKTILAAIQNNGSNKYIGITVKNYGAYQIGAYSASSYSGFSSTGTLGYRLGSDYLKVPRTRQTYTLDLSYRPDGDGSGGTMTMSISPSSTNGTTVLDTPATMSATNSYIPNQLDNANIIVGGCGLSQYDAVNMEVLEFTATKVK